MFVLGMAAGFTLFALGFILGDAFANYFHNQEEFE